MRIIFLILSLFFCYSLFAQSSMRRCTLLPITDSVGGAIGYGVFKEVEQDLKKSNWCTYVSNSGLINVFSRYRENLPQYVKTKEVLTVVSEKLKVGSILVITLKNELNGVEAEMMVFGENGEDIYFSEKSMIRGDEIENISQTVRNWIDMYAKMIPYDAKVNGILGDQITLDVGKGYPISIGQKFLVKRPINKKKHPLLKKIVDWDTEVLAEGKVFNISDNQALGMVSVYKSESKLSQGDWVRLESMPQGLVDEQAPAEEKDIEDLGSLGVLSVSLFGSTSSVDTNTPNGANRMGGNLYGIDFRAEGWITRQYFAAFEIERTLGTLKENSGNPSKSNINVNNSSFKLTGGHKYLPVGFFYGPQIDIYAGYASHTYDLDVSTSDGFGKNTISGINLGTNANIPINREYRLFASAEFIPFPTFSEDDNIYGSAKSSSSMELEIGVKYQYNSKMTLDATIETLSRKAKFNGTFKEVSYKDNRLKLGASFNF
jgi:hypothetical protein